MSDVPTLLVSTGDACGGTPSPGDLLLFGAVVVAIALVAPPIFLIYLNYVVRWVKRLDRS